MIPLNGHPLLRISIRSGKKHPVRTLLMILGIAMGVAGVVAIDIARTSVSKSFELSTSLLTARATHQVVDSRFSLDQNVFTTIRRQLGISKSAPVISAVIGLSGLENRKFTLLGIDPFSETIFRQFEIASQNSSQTSNFSELMVRPGSVFIADTTASELGLSINDSLVLVLGERKVKVTVSGLLKTRDGAVGNAAKGVVITDISLAQEMLNMGDHITRIDLILDDKSQISAVNSILPEGVFLIETDRKNSAVRGLSQSFEMSLTAFSMLALFMGIFLIYNTVSFSVARRKVLHGTLKALGVTQRQIFNMVVFEVMGYALVGSLAGLVLGVLMGKGAVRAVGSTVSEMYFVLTVTRMAVGWPTLLKGLFSGLLASLGACVIPALTASRTLPVTLMQPSMSRSRLLKFLPFLTFSGVGIMAAAGAVLLFSSRYPGIDFIGVFLVFTGASLTVPAGIVFFLHRFRRLTSPISGVILRMAAGNIERALPRTAVLIASLMVAVSVYVGIEIMTQSFRASIAQWVDGHIGGHVHVESMDSTTRSLDPELLAQIEKLPEVKDVSAYNIHRIFSRTSGEVHVFSYEKDLSVKKWAWTAAPENQIQSLVDSGWILVSEIFAQKNGINPGKGANAVLETKQGQKVFKVAGIFRDFFMGGGRVVVSRQTMKRFWGWDDITALQVFLKDIGQVDRVIDAIRQTASKADMLEIVSGRSIKENILKVFDNTFVITIALQILTAVVALTGILNAVMAMLLERAREMGILRACGAQKDQVARLMLAECGLNGAIAGAAAIPLGCLLAWILIKIINQRSFGWTYDMAVSFGVFFEAFLLSCIAAVAAGIFPAFSAGKTNIAKALRME